MNKQEQKDFIFGIGMLIFFIIAGSYFAEVGRYFATAFSGLCIIVSLYIILKSLGEFDDKSKKE